MGIGDLYIDRHDEASSRALETKWRPSGIRPENATPKFLSTVDILLLAPFFSNLLVMIFSAARITPSLHRMPIDVPPFSTALIAYST